ncbi:MAG TPA: hypothetical protein VJT71_11815 [Pyrinomonadaceae bacterium]|nr:hypothetical protein [Pyrinomonadaceae bacterium]
MTIHPSRKLLSYFSRALVSAVLIITSVGLAFAHPSWGIVVSSTGVVYFSDLETVWKIDRAGKLSIFRAGVNGQHVHELSIDAQDNVYGPDYRYEPATDQYFNRIWKMSPNGQMTYLGEPSDRAAAGMSVTLDSAGNMYSIDQNNHTKTQTLLLRRTPQGIVTTLAGGAYGHADGTGTAAKFSSVSAMVFGPDENLYLADGSYVRRVTLNGVVTTLAKDLTARTAEDKPTLFGGSSGGLAGLAVDTGGNVYVADAGSRRLLKISKDGKVTVVYRVDPPHFPNGVFATSTGEVYVLEFSFTLPGTTAGARVRKIGSDGRMTLLNSGDMIQTPGPNAPPPVRVLTQPAILSSYKLTVISISVAVGLILIFLARDILRRRRQI